MKYYKDGNEFSLTEIKKIHSNVSFRDPQQLGYSVIFDTPKPTCGELEQAIHNGVTTDANGNIVRAWLVRDMFSDYQTPQLDADGNEVLDANGDVVYVTVTKLEQETAYLATKAQERVKQAERAVQEHINNECVSLGYDNENSIAKYLVAGNPFYDECSALSLWIGSVWAYVIQVQTDVVAGTRTEPTIDELIAELPVRA